MPSGSFLLNQATLVQSPGELGVHVCLQTKSKEPEAIAVLMCKILVAIYELVIGGTLKEWSIMGKI